MVLEETILKYALSLENVSEQDDEKMKILKRGEKIFLVIEKNTNPLRIELRCDYKLGKNLQDKFESVMQSRALGKNGIEVICAGQLNENELVDLVRHAYEMSAE